MRFFSRRNKAIDDGGSRSLRAALRRARSARSTASKRASGRFEPLETRTMLAADVIITEIMYHPQSEDVREEYIEIYNREAAAVDLSGWKFTQGVDYTFPQNTFLGAGQYLVIAADLIRFEAIHPSVSNVIGGWVGQLSNSGETIKLEDSSGDSASSFEYFDEGDWASREVALGTPNGYDGWRWNAPHDGFGKSLELINRAVTNDSGQNWAPSIPTGGTPGAQNSVNAANIAPLIADVAHKPIIPKPSDSVTVTARISDELASGFSVSVFHRVPSSTDPALPAFTQAPMFDDGLHGDGAAGDGVFGAVLPQRSEGTVVEFYVRAVDSASLARSWPAPTDAATGTQGANALYQVDSGPVVDATLPDYRLILSPYEEEVFKALSRSSNAEINATFVSTVNGLTEVRYNAGVRFRGNGSRSVNPPNQRVMFADDQAWHGLTGINFNSRFPSNQVVGMTIFEQAGLVAEHSQHVHLRRNGTIPAATSAAFGEYAQLEVIDAAWVENHFAGDANGNAYRGAGWTLDNRGTGPYGLEKQTNVSENDWSDIIALARAFDSTITPNAVFVETIEQNINVQEWLRWLAVSALLVNEENGLINNAAGDEYSLYRGVTDPRFVIIPHDLDNILGKGDQGENNPTRDLFEPARNPSLGRLINHASLKPYYYAHLKQLAETVFSASRINATLDAILTGWVSASTIADMKNFAAARVSYVLSQIPPGTPTLSSPQDALRITEVMYNAKQGNDYDFIELRNTSQTTAINLEGVTLAGAVSYTFGNVNLAANQYIVVAANETAFRARYGQTPTLAGEYSGNLNNSGEQILLQAGAPLFNTILDFAYSDLWLPATDGKGKSMVIMNPAAAPSSWGSDESWRESVQNGGSPGADDTEPLGPNSVVVNEVLSHTDLAAGDRVEFRNLTASTVSLAGYYISDDPSNRKKFKIPSGTTIAPGSYVAFSQSSNFGVPTPGNTVFSFSELGDEVYLTAPNGVITIDSIDFSAAEVEVSFGRHVTSTGEVDYPAMSTTTFGAANAAPKIGPVVINEVMYNPLGGEATDLEFVELKNVSASAVQLFDPAHPANTWMFAEGINFEFPSGVSIPAGDFVVLVPFDPVADPLFAATFKTARGIPAGVPLYGPYLGSLDGAGEKIELRKPGPPEPDLTVPLIVVDRFTYDDMPPWPLEADGLGSSLSRRIPAVYANDPGSWDSSRPGGSAGRDNTFIDRTSPSIPSGVTTSLPGPGQIGLSWSASTDPESGVVSYNIYRDNVLIGSSPTTFFTDTMAAPRLRFGYQIASVNGDGLESLRTAVISAGYGAIEAAWSTSDTQVIVQFSEPVAAASASIAANYSLGGANVLSATPRADGRSVLLSTSTLAYGAPYTLQVNNIATTSASPLSPGASITFSHEALVSGISVRAINPVADLAALRDADVALARPNGDAAIAAFTSTILGRVNLVDGAGGLVGHFTGDGAFPLGVATSADYVLRATGVVSIISAATWTFGATADAASSGVRLRIDGNDVLVSPIGNIATDLFGAVPLSVGDHYVELVYFTDSATAGVELFAAPGNFATFNQTNLWRLVGDTAGGGLGVKTFPAAALAMPWSAGAMRGSLVTRFSDTTAPVESGASLRYATMLSAGQTLSLVVSPVNFAASATVNVRRGTTLVASVSSNAPGGVARLDNLAIVGGGLHTIEIATSATTTLNVSAALDTAFEAEAYGLGGNDSIATAQNINAATVAFADGRSRLAVAGQISLPGSYTALVAAANPLGRWRLNEPAGGDGIAINLGSAGAGVDGIYFGGVTRGSPSIVPNVSGFAPAFGGSTGRVEIADSAAINSGGPYSQRTVELWFNAGDVAARRVIFDEGNVQRGMNVYVDGGLLYVGAYNTIDDDGAGTAAPWGPIFLSTPITAGKTYHVVATLDGAARTFAAYLNGVGFGQSASAGPLYGHSTGVRIGRRTDTLFHDGSTVTGSGNAFLGTIAEVSIYGTAFTGAQVAALYQAGAARPDDYYAVDLTAGQPTTFALDATTVATWTLELQNAAGAVLAVGTTGDANLDASIRNFTATVSGTYYVRTSANVDSAYTLVVSRGAEVEREDNDSLAAAQDMTAAGAVVGGLDTPSAIDSFSVDVAAGQTLNLETATPDGLVGAGGTVWNPRIELYSPGGALLASNDNGAADGRNAKLSHAATAAGRYVVMVRSSSGSGDYLLTASTSGGSSASLVDVVVRGSDWSADLRSYLTAHGLGQGGWSVMAANPAAANLPWTNVNQIELAFDRPVSAVSEDLTVSGVNLSQYGIATSAVVGNSVIWTLQSPLPVDRFTVDLSTQLESKLGGSNRQFQFAVAPGDVNDNDVVTLDDALAGLPRQFSSTASANYDPRHDVDGNGVVNYVDLIHIRNAIGGQLPPSSPAASAVVQVATMAKRAPAALVVRRRLPAIAVDASLSQANAPETPSTNSLRARRITRAESIR